MAKGNCVFFGDVEGAVQFYEKNGWVCGDGENPAEMFLDALVPRRNDSGELINVEGADKLIAAWKAEGRAAEHGPIASPERADEPVAQKPERNLGRLAELKIVTKRFYSVIRRDKAYFWSINVLVILSGLLCFAVFFQIPDNGFAAVQNRIGFFIYMVFDGTAFSTMVALIFQYNHAIRRERYRSWARASSYYWAFMLIQFPFWLFSVLVSSTILYYTSGLRYTPFGAMLLFLYFVLAITLQALAMGVIFSAASENIEVALTASTFFFTISNLFNGAVINTNNVTWILRWLRYINPIYYMTIGATQNEFDGQIIDGQPGEYWMSLFGMDGVSVLWCSLILLGMTIFTLIVGVVFFHRISRPFIKV